MSPSGPRKPSRRLTLIRGPLRKNVAACQPSDNVARPTPTMAITRAAISIESGCRCLSRCRSIQVGVEAFRRPRLVPLAQMPITVGDVGRVVADLVADLLKAEPRFEQQRGVGVAALVQADWFEPGGLPGAYGPVVGAVVVEGRRRRLAEDEADPLTDREAVFAMRDQVAAQDGGDRHRARALLRLRRDQALDPVPTVLDADHAAGQSTFDQS